MEKQERSFKRERNVNFSPEETERLLELLVSNKHIIENKKSDAATWQEKENAWREIESEFNSSGLGPFRDAKHLKIKYDALKRDTRKKCSAERNCGGAGTATPLTPVEIKIKEMILLSLEEGECSYDSDQFHSILEVYAEPSRKKTCPESVPSTSKRKESVEVNGHSKEKEKRPYDSRPKEDKIEIVELQKKIKEEEITEKVLRLATMKLELENKKELFQLEKQEMMLKIEILKIQLERLKKHN